MLTPRARLKAVSNWVLTEAHEAGLVAVPDAVVHQIGSRAAMLLASGMTVADAACTIVEQMRIAPEQETYRAVRFEQEKGKAR